MIKVLVTEDELPILRSTSKLIEKVNPYFKVKYKAVNGKEALKLLQEYSVDLLMLDIHMPVLDGVELLKRMSELGIKVPTIVVSGYQDFHYVRDALYYGAIDYLLKPLKIDDLKEQLIVVEELILNNKCKNINVANTIQNYDEVDNCYELALVCIGGYVVNNDNNQSLGEKEELHNLFDNYLSKLISCDDYWIIPGNEDCEKLLIFRKIGSRTKKILTDFIHEKGECISPITIVLSDKSQNINSLYSTIYKLRRILQESLNIEENSVYIGENNIPYEENQKEIEKYQNIILEAQFPRQIFPKIKESIKNIQRRKVIFELLKIAFLHYSNKFKSECSFTELEEELYSIVNSNNSINSICKDIEKLSVDIFCYDENRKFSKEKLALDIKNYIEKNFEKQITNSVLKDKFGFVSTYIRDIFKQKYGESPIKYLQNIRLQKSEEWLLENLELSVKEISVRVGFTDSLYFSKVFHKTFGVSPSDYRRLGGQNENE